MQNRKVIRFIIGLVAFLAVFEIVSRVMMVLIMLARRYFLPAASGGDVATISAAALALSYLFGLWAGIRVWIRIYAQKRPKEVPAGKGN